MTGTRSSVFDAGSRCCVVFCLTDAAGSPAIGRRRDDFACRTYRGTAEVDVPIHVCELEDGVYAAASEESGSRGTHLVVRCKRSGDYIDGLKPFAVYDFPDGTRRCGCGEGGSRSGGGKRVRADRCRVVYVPPEQAGQVDLAGTAVRMAGDSPPDVALLRTASPAVHAFEDLHRGAPYLFAIGEGPGGKAAAVLTVPDDFSGGADGVAYLYREPRSGELILSVTPP